MQKTEKEACSCTKKLCERHGDCPACIAYHAAHKRFQPYCRRERRGRKSAAAKP